MLPIRKVVLYKHGVGYFERRGEVSGDASVDLHFKAPEMNDVLKSLTTLDLSDGLVSSISYESTRPIDKQLEDVAVRLPDQSTLTGLLGEIKGARVAVEAGTQRIEGAVIGIDPVSREVNGSVVSGFRLTLMVDGATLRSFDLLELKSLTFLDEALKKDLQHLLDILITSKKKDLKKLTIFTKGKGARELLASYIVETPVWKTSYRMLMGSAKPVLQGWAIVDNTQDDDWESVQLSLVSGLPISFIHDLYSPRYKRRPVVEVREEEAYAPPQLESPVEFMEEDAEAPETAPVMSAGAGAPMKSKRAMAADRAEARTRSNPVQTRTVEIGDLFQYEIKNPVTVRRGQSALVPILQQGFEGKRVAVYNPEIRDKNPMSAVLFKNSTGMTLEGGPVTVLEDETYVGESMLETLKPDEERLVPYSVELGCRISLDDKSELKSVRMARILNGALTLYRYRVSKKIYVISNKTEKPLDLFLEHRFIPGWDLVETDKPLEKTDHYYRFRFDIPARKNAKFIVTERGDEYETFSLTSVNRDQVRVWLESKYIDRNTMGLLLSLIEVSEKIGETQQRIQAREQEVQEIFQNQERLRKNLQAMGASSDEKGLRERYVGEMAREEDRLKELRTEVAKAKGEKLRLEKDLKAQISILKFEAAL